MRSLKSDGWTDEEIAAHAKEPGFVSIAGRIHERRNAETARWSEMGRQVRQQQQQPSQDQSQTQPKNEPAILKPVDTAKLKQKYGDDAMIDEIVSPINAVVEQINKMLPAVQESQQRAQRSEIETLSRQVDGFFGGKELEPYAKMYGNPTSETLTQEQIASRNKVLEEAGFLMDGARQAGRSFTLDEALHRAHDSLSSGYKEQVVRTQIKQQLKVRNKGISLKPAARGTAVKPGGAPRTRTDLERKVGQGLKAAFA
jgi:hypothetical protein